VATTRRTSLSALALGAGETIPAGWSRDLSNGAVGARRPVHALRRRVRRRHRGDASSARLAFAEADKPEGTWAGRRLLVLDDKPAFELSFWCGTCPFLFERLEGAHETLSPRRTL
jgi:hypothetical protein